MTAVEHAAPALPRDLVGHVTRLSERLVRLDAPFDAATAVEDTRRRARELGLAPEDLDAHLRRGLKQSGALGPDEVAEYRRNLRAVLDAVGVADPRRPTAPELFAAFLRMGREVASSLAAALPRQPDRTVVFLGTDAEHLKIVHDLLADDPQASTVFYLSRLSLLSDAERTVLSRTSRTVFGADEVTARSSEGRHRAWMDNGLVASQLARLVSGARALAQRSAAGGETFEQLFLARFADEVAHRTDQRARLRQGPLTMFGTPLPETDAVVRAGIDSGLFTERCLDAGRRLLARSAADPRPLTVVDIGANGTQPALLMGAAEVLGSAAEVSVCLFTPHPDRWGPPGGRFRLAQATSLFALGVETVKTFATDYRGAAQGAGHTLAELPADQRLLAHLKHLAFHRAALEVRARSAEG
ncbi:hypothetical protein P3T36_006607 [Kitasatospora sp. MAP12-15]|uniref:hypothetical protein n=1 Tax=unclassified Kitasatospora TaxID=2633591 RepID=UPI00247439F3|nr:hypothetical protein [Kitasatospora sp. MAP12-44]MDH6115451.1 hypothetical protein [Kitasatospora sp. MAP12-44]